MDVSKKIYFVSDVHLGAASMKNNREREHLFVNWLDQIKDSAKAIFLVGDIFDYWYEYKKVVPKGFIRTLGKLCEITDSGIPVYFFKGNHDLWTWGYLENEVGLKVFSNEQEFTFEGKSFLIAHGDDVGGYDKKYFLLRKIFTNRILQRLFSCIHPDLSCSLAHAWSKHSRLSHTDSETKYHGKDREYQVLYAKKILSKRHFDYFIFGHRHLFMDISLTSTSKLCILGDWINQFSYAVFDGQDVFLEKFINNRSNK